MRFFLSKKKQHNTTRYNDICSSHVLNQNERIQDDVQPQVSALSYFLVSISLLLVMSLVYISAPGIHDFNDHLLRGTALFRYIVSWA